jgi:type VI secretion system protein ImpA
MPLREDILNPIPGDSPSGRSLRLSEVYDKIKEARREDDSLAQGAWQRERKVANHAQAVQLAQDALATQSKDLQLAAWLCDSLLKKEGIGGLRDGINLAQALVDRFWDTLYPQLEDGELDDRAAPLEWVASKLLIPIKSVPLCRGGYSFLEYKDSRTVEYEDLARSKDQKAVREKALKDGKLAPEVFDKSFIETAKTFYADLESHFDGALKAVDCLDETCVARFGLEGAPSFTRLQETLQEVRHIVHQLLQKKREVEPDPVQQAPPAAAIAAQPEPAVQPLGLVIAATVSATTPVSEFYSQRAVAESPDTHEAITTIAAAAADLRRRNAFSPAPYLMLRGLRWGELRASRDPSVLEAPPGELRQRVKRLAMDSNWRELLELAENVMALPCGRAWLDLQRLVIEACAALGEEYAAIAIAIRSEIRALMRDLPQLMDATLNDETPAANSETRAWLCDLLNEPAGPPLPAYSQRTAGRENSHTPGWQKKYVDPHMLALEAARSGEALRAIQILQNEMECQPSGRGRFQRKLQLAQVCLSAGKDAIAQPLLDDIAAAIELHKLDDWEDSEMVAGALAFLMQSSKKIQGDAKARQTIFERICRLDPVKAVSV